MSEPDANNQSKEYKKLIIKRANAVRALIFHAEKVEKLQDNQTTEASTRQAAIEAAYEKFKQINEEIEDHDEFDPQNIDEKTEEITEKFIVMIAKLRTITKDVFDASLLNSTTAPRMHSIYQDIKLPRIELPLYDGSYENWVSFYDAFISMVDSNPSLSDRNKMIYLKSALTDSALNTIGHLKATDLNYKIAMKTLQERFNNKRAIVNSCLKSLMCQTKMQRATASEIRKLIDTTKESIQTLEALNISIYEWDAILVFLIQTKMDISTQKEWENHLGGSTNVPKYASVIEFLETRFRITNISESNTQSLSFEFPKSGHVNTLNQSSSYRYNDGHVYNRNENNDRRNTFRLDPTSSNFQASNNIQNRNNENRNFEPCPLCNENHFLFYCRLFNEWTIVQRKQFVNDNRICVNCLRKHDMKYKCKGYCRNCNGNHNTKLHEEIELNQSNQNVCTIQMGEKLLATAIVKVKDRFGTNHLMRAFIDQGSQGTFISEKATQLLCLPRICENLPLTGIDNKPLGIVKTKVQIQIESLVDKSFQLSIEAFIMSSIINPTDNSEHVNNNWKHLDEIILADPDYLNPKQIDLLFGVDVYGLIILDGLRKGSPYEPVAQNSTFGWLIYGSINIEHSNAIRTKNIASESTLAIKINSISIRSIAEELRKFWENEEIDYKPKLTEENIQCVEHFKNNIQRLNDGSFMVAMPFNMDPLDDNFLGESRRTAMRRLFQLEKRFKRDPLYHDRYNEEMKSYMKMGHMSLSKSNINNGYYLPHHAIVRENSTTTKQRTVYDASAKSSNGFSLNERCLKGPTIQPDLFDIYIRWRTNKIALNADIEKMYRMIRMRPEDRKYHKILYRFSEKESIQTYELNTITFGTKPAPYMAIATTFELADAEEDKFPEASKRIKTDFYVDDCLSGSHSIESTIILQKELDELMKSGKFSLRKWASNNHEVLKNIPIENRAIKTIFEITNDTCIRTVGTTWNTETDQLSFIINIDELSSKIQMTKRQLLSDSSKLYDPCGLLSPITIKAKIMMQEVWKSGTDWDDLVPSHIQAEWNNYREQLTILEQITINRWFQTQINSTISLHGFCDSSERAMACVIYLIQKCGSIVSSILVCSKTKLAPIKTETIPRLELIAADMLATLMNRVMNNLKIKKSSVYLWTDSSIVLMWLKAHSSKWNQFVANRVGNIQKSFDSSYWRHVRTHENPADIASRGIFPNDLINNNLWFHGPKWLILNEYQWPNIELEVSNCINFEMKHNKTHVNTIQLKQQNSEPEILKRFSNIVSLMRITSLMLRFIHQTKREETLKYSIKSITIAELNRAKFFWIKIIQNLNFDQEIVHLKSKGKVDEKSNLKTLNPKLNEQGVLIVHGRLEYADWSPYRKFPIILPSKSYLSYLIIENAHSCTLHGTIHLTLAYVRNEYWILNARNLVKSHIHKCISCYKHKPQPLSQLMAPLPHMKISPSRPFLHCGIDFAGPIKLKSSKLKNAKIMKGYICVFVCMVSKAAHLEAVSDYSSAQFIMALRRFISRRGICSDIYSDQGTNFKGASNELPRLFLQSKSQVSTDIQRTFSNDRIKFHFNPPSAPHWGGQWESFVKLTKHHLNRLTFSITLTFEELNTMLTQIEACINSRPLCAITNDINDFDSLTPGHLLIGSPLNLIPEPSLMNLKDNTLDRYQLIQKGVQTFWKRFHIEYLHTLHPRKKWNQLGDTIYINDLVIIIDDDLPPAKWHMGRVVQTHKGKDGHTRMVTLQVTSNSAKTNTNKKRKLQFIDRPIAKICKLPIAGPPEDVLNLEQK